MKRPFLPSIALLASLAFGLGCGSAAPRGERPPEPAEARRFAVLAINDVYRIEGVDGGAYGGLARVRGLRQRLEREHPDLLVLHAGDFLYPSLLSRQYDGEQMVDVMSLLDGDSRAFDQRLLVTFGNHEFDAGGLDDAFILDRRIEESQFRWLGSNLEFAKGEDGEPLIADERLVPRALLESSGVKVGVFSLTTDLARPEYVASFGDLEEVARREVAGLRALGAQVVIALTHLEMARDLELLRALGEAGPDVVFGGHEHEKQARDVDGRWVIKADAEARTATIAELIWQPGAPLEVLFEWRELGPAGVAPDPLVSRRVAEWLELHGHDFCADRLNREPGCLDDVLGRTRVRLRGEELEIRRYETNLGDWITDRALAHFAPRGAQVAFVNSGSLRLNQDVPPGEVTRRHLEETFAYPAGLLLVRLDGRTLQKVIERSIENWTGEGHWLQVSGFAFRHDPATGRADRLTLLGTGGPRLVDPDEEVLAVVNDYLLDVERGQDGYTMLKPEMVISTPEESADLKDLVVQALEESGEEGIAPRVEGRICNTQRAGPCLAVDVSR